MDTNLLRQVQLTQLEIAKEVKRVCNENNIKYFLDSGTLLGALRHKGFIPWDDDMDLGMIRKEYEHFLEVAPIELGDNYFLQTWDSDSEYPYAYSKVRKKGTTYVEAVNQNSNTHNEIYIDIFPYDNYPDKLSNQNKQGRKIMFYRHTMIMKSSVKPWVRQKYSVKRVLVYLKYLPFKLVGFFQKREVIKEKYKKEMIRYNQELTLSLYEQSGAAPYGKWVIPAKCFENYKEYLFEDTKFTGPENSDLYLKSTYGDYMKLPPIEKRENRHQIIEVKL